MQNVRPKAFFSLILFILARRTSESSIGYMHRELRLSSSLSYTYPLRANDLVSHRFWCSVYVIESINCMWLPLLPLCFYTSSFRFWRCSSSPRREIEFKLRAFGRITCALSSYVHCVCSFFFFPFWWLVESASVCGLDTNAQLTWRIGSRGIVRYWRTNYNDTWRVLATKHHTANIYTVESSKVLRDAH